MNIQAFVLAVVVAIVPCAGHADAGSISQQQTDAIVAKFQAAYADAFDRRDARAMAALLTENATLQNVLYKGTGAPRRSMEIGSHADRQALDHAQAGHAFAGEIAQIGRQRLTGDACG